MTRTSYPIPPGYRMLAPGEIIQQTDLYWSGNEFTSVLPPDYTGQKADPAIHSCLIRSTVQCQNCGTHMAGLHNWAGDTRDAYACSQACLRALERKWILESSHNPNLIKPAYYRTDDVYEPFKIIRHYGLNFFEGNVLKYLLRAGKKSKATRLEDLRKAYTYLASEIEQSEKDGDTE